MPTVTQLEYVLAVQRTGHFGRAAEECGVAQPTLSAQIQKVEHELGVTLFDRAQKPVVLTSHGNQLMSHARDVVAAHERLLWAARDEGCALSGDFRLGIIPTLAPYVIPWFLKGFSEGHPRLALKLHEQPTDVLIDELLNQKLDAAILATPLGVAGLHEEAIFYDPFYLYAHADEPVLEDHELAPSKLEAEKIWLLEDGHCVRTQVTSFCSLPGTSLHLKNVQFAAGSFETLRNLIDATGGYSLFPETYVRSLPKSVRRDQVRSFNPTPTREVSLAYLKSSWKTQAFDALAKTLRSALPRSLRQNASNGELLPVR
ncbi:MAG: hydrogen peroxide-inducible genes activator [Myxococcota bacterium]